MSEDISFFKTAKRFSRDEKWINISKETKTNILIIEGFVIRLLECGFKSKDKGYLERSDIGKCAYGAISVKKADKIFDALVEKKFLTKKTEEIFEITNWNKYQANQKLSSKQEFQQEYTSEQIRQKLLYLERKVKQNKKLSENDFKTFNIISTNFQQLSTNLQQIFNKLSTNFSVENGGDIGGEERRLEEEKKEEVIKNNFNEPEKFEDKTLQSQSSFLIETNEVKKANKEKKQYSQDFTDFWENYPETSHKTRKEDCSKLFEKNKKQNFTFLAEIKQALENYKSDISINRIEAKFVKSPLTFIRYYEDHQKPHQNQNAGLTVLNKIYTEEEKKKAVDNFIAEVQKCDDSKPINWAIFTKFQAEKESKLVGVKLDEYICNEDNFNICLEEYKNFQKKSPVNPQTQNNVNSFNKV